MGHERVGALPRTKRWSDVVDGIAAAAAVDGDVGALATGTLANVRSQLRAMQGDTGVIAAFEFLIGLALSASSRLERESLGHLAVDLESNPSPLRLAAALGQHVEERRESLEYAEIARKAAVDTVSLWTQEQTQQLSFTAQGERVQEVWARASDGRGFCEVSRIFFARLVERYLNYFLSREASARVDGTEARERLATRLRDHVDGVSHHAFETSRITQSFAAGWFNAHARDRVPTTRETASFLAVALGKLHEELLREESPQ